MGGNMNNFQPAHIPIAKVEMHIPKPLTDVTESLSDFTCRSKSFSFEERPSGSPFIETIWRTPIATIPPTRNENSGPYIFPAVRHWGLVVAKQNGKKTITMWGPGTKATPALCPRESEIFGIIFKQGAFMPHLPLSIVRDRRDVTLPEATSKSFWLNGSAWQFPDYENADTFVDRLVRCDLLVRDEMVDSVLQGQLKDVSLRTAQRRFLQATGLTHNTVRQMERARFAKGLLQHGISILDTIAQAGYYDQAHLTRSLKHFIGLTPVQIVRLSQSK
jgi:AraC-like DNA-binding protein